jgi:two-component system, OmpR family, response regulator MprA
MPNRWKAQILIVDEDPAVRTTLGMFLMSAGYDVATADNGITAVAHLSSTVPDLLVTDLNMPLMSGIELISHLRSLHPKVPIVAMSGDYLGEAVPAGIIADRFYPKGQNLQHLLATIASLIAMSPAKGIVNETRTRPELDS